jgi:hypothetical protein
VAWIGANLVLQPDVVLASIKQQCRLTLCPRKTFNLWLAEPTMKPPCWWYGGRSFSSFGQRCLLIPRLPFGTAFGQGCSGKLWKARPEALRARSRSWHTWVNMIAWKKYRTPAPGAWEAFYLLTRMSIFGQAIGDPAGQQIWECFAAYLALRLWRSRHTLSVSKHVLRSSYLECMCRCDYIVLVIFATWFANTV